MKPLKITLNMVAFVIVAVIFISGCATSYQSTGFTGGYSETQLAPDVFRIRFAGNGYTSGERAQDFAMLRAADLALQHGFKYFAVIDESSSTAVSRFTTPGSATTTGSAYVSGGDGNYYGSYSGQTKYTPPQTYNVFKSRAGLLIRCFTDKQEAIYTFDAVFLQQSLKQKYHITTPATEPVVNRTSPNNPSITNAPASFIPDWAKTDSSPQPVTNAADTNVSDYVPVSPSGTNAETTLFEEIKAKAGKGDAATQCRLGELFSRGFTDVDGKSLRQEKNEKEAIKWFSKAAEQNYQLAWLELGELFLAHNDYSEAVKWLRKAADFGYVMAMETLGEVNQNGLGVAKDYEEAAHWYRMAAEQGECASQHSLGMMYEHGDGVAKDYVEAYKWYNIAIANPDYQKDQAWLRERIKLKLNTDESRIGEFERDLNALESRMTSGQSNGHRHRLFHHRRRLFDFQLSRSQRCRAGSLAYWCRHDSGQGSASGHG
jgi:TPR repeat protein